MVVVMMGLLMLRGLWPVSGVVVCNAEIDGGRRLDSLEIEAWLWMLGVVTSERAVGRKQREVDGMVNRNMPRQRCDALSTSSVHPQQLSLDDKDTSVVIFGRDLSKHGDNS